MIEEQVNIDSHQILARPNRSASWQFNKWLIASLLILSGGIASVFAFLGAWMILPFAGIELTLLSACLYYVCWKLNYMQVIRLESEEVVIENGVYYPKQSWRISRNDVIISIAPNRHPMSAPDITLKAKEERISIGNFLNKEEREELAEKLKNAGLLTIRR